jgi:hypothetical protein
MNPQPQLPTDSAWWQAGRTFACRHESVVMYVPTSLAYCSECRTNLEVVEPEVTAA